MVYVNPPAIREIDAQDIPPLYSRRWKALARELLLRLEKTPADKALEVPLESPEVVERAYKSLYAYFKLCKGLKAVKIACRGNAIYVQRGKNWIKGELPQDKNRWARWEREETDSDAAD